MMQLSVVVPALNEAANLPELVSRVVNALRQAERRTADDEATSELVVVDDGSDDETPAVLAELATKEARLKFVRHPERRGIPAAWQSGVEAARGEWICVLDADLQYAPEEIAALWREACESRRTRGVTEGVVEIVQGVRIERSVDARLLVSRGLNVILNTIFGMSLADNKSGFFLCPRATFLDLLSRRPPGYRHWQCFVMVAAVHQRCRVLEVRTPFVDRHRGRSAFGRIPIRATFEVMFDLKRAWTDYGPGLRGGR